MPLAFHPPGLVQWGTESWSDEIITRKKQELLQKAQHIGRLTLQVGGCPCTHGVHCYKKKDAIAALMRPHIKSA